MAVSARVWHVLRRAERIGIAIDSAGIRAVGVGHGRVMWAIEAGRTPDEPLAQTLAGLLASRPRHRRGRLAAHVVIGPSHSQIRQLSGLPALKKAQELENLVRESASRFFLWNGAPLITFIDIEGAGPALWAAAVEQSIVASIVEGCGTAGVSVAGVAPMASVMAIATQQGTVTRRDGAVCEELEVSGGRLVSVRRLWTEPSITVDESIQCDGALAAEARPVSTDAVAPEAERYADAYLAAIHGERARLLLRPSRMTRRWSVTSSRRLGIAAGAAILAAGLALVAAPARETLVAGRAKAELQALGASLHEALAVESELRKLNEQLAQVAAFQGAGVAPVLVLANLTQTLPDGAALASLRLKGGEGTAVLMSGHAASALDALDQAPWVGTLEILGPVTRERVGGQELERATIRFTRPASGKSGSRSIRLRP